VALAIHGANDHDERRCDRRAGASATVTGTVPATVADSDGDAASAGGSPRI
jgi:hypothetical protein